MARTAAFAALLLFVLAGSAAANVTSLFLLSDEGDYVGQGQLLHYSWPEVSISVQPFGTGVIVTINSLSTGDPWFVALAAPDGAPLSVGEFPGAVGVFSQGPGQPGLEVYGQARACGHLTGSFEVLQVVYGASGQVVSLRATFEQQCGGLEAGLRGEIRYNATVPFELGVSATHSAGADGQPMTIGVIAFDVADAPAALTAIDAPAGAELQDHGDGTALFTWTPTPAQAGVHTFGFQGTDAQGRTDTIVVRVTISPANDDFEAARAIGGAGAFQGGLAEATTQPDEPNTFARSVWFEFTPPASGRWALEVTGTADMDPRLHVFEDPTPHTPATLNELVVIGDQSWPSKMVFDATAGHRYFVVVGTFDPDDGGVFTLTWRRAELTRVLWRHLGGAVTIWTLDDAGAIVAHPTYGPFTGWEPVRLAIDNHGYSRVLWKHASGLATLWKVNASGAIVANPVYGPYPGWTVGDISIRSDGEVHLAWISSTGGLALWQMPADADSLTGSVSYGPYPGWQPLGIAVDGYDYRRLLWRGATGAIGLWEEDPWSYGSPAAFEAMGPFSGWTAIDVAAGSTDGSTRLLWRHITGAAGLWRRQNYHVTSDSTSYGPFAGWEPVALATPHPDEDYGDVYSRILWRHTSGAISVWKTGPTGGLASSFIYGPFAGWSVVDVAAGPE